MFGKNKIKPILLFSALLIVPDSLSADEFSWNRASINSFLMLAELGRHVKIATIKL